MIHLKNPRFLYIDINIILQNNELYTVVKYNAKKEVKQIFANILIWIVYLNKHIMNQSLYYLFSQYTVIWLLVKVGWLNITLNKQFSFCVLLTCNPCLFYLHSVFILPSLRDYFTLIQIIKWSVTVIISGRPNLVRNKIKAQFVVNNKSLS